MSASTILVVDDCQSVRLSVKRILSEAGYTVITASDGEEALCRMSDEPDLVVLDINMPKVDGIEFCERVNHSYPEYRETPIVFLTSEDTSVLRVLGNELGAYLQKPVDERDLLDTLAFQLS